MLAGRVTDTDTPANRSSTGRPKTSQAWRAGLDLTFVERGGRTVLSERASYGPLRIQKPFYPEGGTCHLYLLHPPGALAAGDELAIDVHLEPGARALITTPAAGKFYRSSGRIALQQQALSVAEGASLEWLPQENLLFGGSRVRIATGVKLHPDARFIGWEITALGRPLSGDHYRSGNFDQSLEIFVGGRPLLVERQRSASGERAIAASWGLNDHSVFGTLSGFPADRDLCEAVRAQLVQSPETSVGATLVDGVFILRVLGRTTETCRRELERALRVMRPAIMGKPFHDPRIWRT